MYFTETELYLNKRVALACLAALSLWLVIALIESFADWQSAPSSESMNEVIQVPHHNYQLEDISSWHLLGGNPNAGSLPETNLQLSLQGVLTMTDTAHSSAIIAQQGQPAEVYQPGDLLPGGAILAKVMADRVIIQNRGKLETLSLIREKLQFTPIPPSLWP